VGWVTFLKDKFNQGATAMTLPTGSGNYFSLFVRENLKNRPQDFTITDAQLATIEKQQAARRAVDNKINAKPEAARSEYNRLNGQLFNLTQHAKATESRVNNVAGTVKLLEVRTAEALKIKKQHEDAGNLMGARTYERQIQGLEDELVDEREKLIKEQGYNQGAARALRTWQTENGPRLLELKKQVG
jgi:hypothetical protein